MFISKSVFLPFYIVFLLVGTLERVTSTFIKKSQKSSLQIYYKWTFFVPFLTYILIICASIVEYFTFVKNINLSITIFGIIVFFAGMLLRRKAISDLGENWSVYIEIKKGHEFIKKGVYNFLKHPYCVAVLLELMGICLVSNSFYSTMLIITIQLPLLIMRVFLEEKVLINYFGNAYRS